MRDIEAISKIARRYNALVIVDNTFATPALQKPLMHGADIAFGSLTKGMNGYGDELGGYVTGPALFMLKDEPGYLFFQKRVNGATLAAISAYNIYKGIITLPERMEKQCDNAEKIVRYLMRHPLIKRVYYPGLGDNRKIAQKQMARFGNMIAFEVHGGYDAVSLGLYFTVFSHSASTTHHCVPEEERVIKGIPESMIRGSMGKESYMDIRRTIGNCLKKAA